MMDPTQAPARGFEWRHLLTLAEQLSREFDNEAALRSAISRAYYAVFALARRRLSHHGCWAVARDPHKRVWATYRDSTEVQCQDIGHRGFNLLDRRKRADYDDWIGGVPAKQAAQALDVAREILDLLDSLDPSESCCPPAADAGSA